MNTCDNCRSLALTVGRGKDKKSVVLEHFLLIWHIIRTLPNSRLTILPSLLIGKSGRLYIRVVVWLVGQLFVRHGRDSSDVTLVFEDAQVIQTVMDDE